jgi:hypothetical protein
MILNSFGCSFIFGTGLVDDGHNGPYAAGSKLTWPALLAEDLGYQYQTYARPGSGNLQILERLLAQAVNTAPSVCVVGWTYIDRFDYMCHDHESWPGIPWKTATPGQDDPLAECYYKYFHSQLKDKLCTLVYIKTAIDALKQKNIPFVMTYVDELIFETQWHTTAAIVDLQNYILPYMTKFEGQTFLEFTKTNNYPISATAHPLEPAHQAAFELIKSYNLL